jgi:hypothetical protein
VLESAAFNSPSRQPDGAAIGLDWKQYLWRPIHELIFGKGIGAATLCSHMLSRQKGIGPYSSWKDNESAWWSDWWKAEADELDPSEFNGNKSF